MSLEILMPALSPTMTEGNINKWLVKVGDKVKAGDIIAEIETDKATMEVEAVDEGIVKELLVSENQSVKVSTPIAILTNKDSDSGSQKSKVDNTLEENSPKEKNKINLNDKEILEKDLSEEKKVQKNSSKKIITMRQAIRDTIYEEMIKDKDIYIIGEEVAEYQGAYKVTQGLLEKFSDKRVIDTPISEQGFTGFAIGSAFKGLRPIVEFMTFNFSMQAIDQIINSAAKTLYMSGGQINCPIVFRGPNGAASQVAAQHSQDFTSWYTHCPGLKVLAPSTPYNAKGLLRSAIRDNNPVIFLENEILYSLEGEVSDDKDFTIPIGKAEISRNGKDVTLVTYSIMLQKSLLAADQLKKDYDIEVEIIDLQSLRPLDVNTIIESVKKTNRLITVEESWPINSLGSEIANIVQREAFDYLDSPIIKVNSADVPMPYSSFLEKNYLPQVDDIILALKKVCYI